MEPTLATWVGVATALLVLFVIGITIASVMEERQKTTLLLRLSRYLSAPQGPREARINTTFQQRIIQPVLDKLKAMISTRLSDTVGRQIRQKLLNAGYPIQMTPEEFLVKRGCVVVALTLVVGGLCVSRGIAAGQAVYATFMCALVLGVMTKYSLESRIKRRQAEIERELPEILDYLQVGVEAGLSVDNSLDRIVAEPSKAHMIYEFKLYLQDMKMGLQRAEALHQLYYRTQSKSVKNFADGIVQSVKTGMPLGDVLQIIRRDIYDAIRTEAEKRAIKAPVVMMIPLILFIFPTVFIVTVGPTVLIMIKELKKMM